MRYPYKLSEFRIPASLGEGFGSLDYSWAITKMAALAKKYGQPYPHKLLHFEYIRDQKEIIAIRINALQYLPMEMRFWVKIRPVVFAARSFVNAVKYLVGWWDVDVSHQYCKKTRTVYKPYNAKSVEVCKVVFLIPWLGLIKKWVTDENGQVTIKNDVYFEWLWRNPLFLYRSD